MTVEEPQRRQRPRPRYRTVSVNRVQRLTPHLVRVTLTGSDLEGFAEPGPARHVKVFFPGPGEDLPVMPEWGPNGPVLAEGQQRPISRTYTPRRWDAGKLELDLEIVVHGEGLGSTWVENAQIGDQVIVAGPGGRFHLDPEADWYLLAGDDTAVPAMSTILETLPESAHAIGYLEVSSAAEQIPLETRADVQLTWLYRDHNPAAPGRLLEQAIRETALPPGQGFAWVACESSVMRDIRAYLLNDAGLDRTAMHTQGYWKAGVSNHPDHDLGE